MTCCWITLLKGKNEAAQVIINWTRLVKNMYGAHPKEFHSDNGTEFVNNILTKHWASIGTKMAVTIPYTPQHNGKVERLNRTLIECTRALMINAGAPKSLWGEAIKTAEVLRNITSIKVDSARPQAEGEFPAAPFNASADRAVRQSVSATSRCGDAMHMC